MSAFEPCEDSPEQRESDTWPVPTGKRPPTSAVSGPESDEEAHQVLTDPPDAVRLTQMRRDGGER